MFIIAIILALLQTALVCLQLDLAAVLAPLQTTLACLQLDHAATAVLSLPQITLACLPLSLQSSATTAILLQIDVNRLLPSLFQQRQS